MDSVNILYIKHVVVQLSRHLENQHLEINLLKDFKIYVRLNVLKQIYLL